MDEKIEERVKQISEVIFEKEGKMIELDRKWL